jgi:regulator of replication initiation timing
MIMTDKELKEFEELLDAEDTGTTGLPVEARKVLEEARRSRAEADRLRRDLADADVHWKHKCSERAKQLGADKAVVDGIKAPNWG